MRERLREYQGIALLTIASLIVAVAIVADGQVARTINGIGGLIWIGAALVLVRYVRSNASFGPLLTLAAFATLILVLFTHPSDYVSAALSFVIAGAVVGFAANAQSIVWSATVPALWLPIHLVVAIVKVLERAIRDRPASVRTEPPPTSALVPFVMVIAALLGGIAIQKWKARESPNRSVHQGRTSKA
jgi:hypothetical protein